MRLLVTPFRLPICPSERAVALACLCLSLLSVHRAFGARLWAEETKARITLQGHADAVYCVAFSPDGKTLASVSNDHKVKLWDVASGKERATFQGHTSWMESVAFSPDGKTLASAGFDETIKLWDVVLCKERATLNGHNETVRAVAFSPDGKTLASASDDQTIKLWNVVTGQERAVLRGHTDEVDSVMYSPDGKTLASGSKDTTIKFWDVATGQERATLRADKDVVRWLAYSPDGKTLASAGDDKTVRLWDTATGKERGSLRGHSRWVRSVAFSPDGKTLASASADGTIKLWSATSGKERVTLFGHSNTVTSVAYSPDGKVLASAGVDKTIKLWNIPVTQATPSSRSGVLTSEDLNGLWAALESDDEAEAYRGIGELTSAPEQTVPLLKVRLRFISKVKAQDVSRWISELDSEQFAVREAATEELEKAGEQAEAALRTKSTEKLSVEVRHRIEHLLVKIEQPTPHSIRGLRTVEVLEDIGTTEAKKVLENLATGAEGARLTEEAKASLLRLSKQAGDK